MGFFPRFTALGLLTLAFLFAAPVGRADDAPECLDKMLEVYLGALEAMGPSTVHQPSVGIEVEAYLPRRSDAIQGESRNHYFPILTSAIQEAVGKGVAVQGVRAVRRQSGLNNYSIKYQLGGEDYEWKLIGDASLDISDDWEGSEIVSPILRTDRDLEIFGKVIQSMQKAGMREDARTGGTHVHVGMPDARVFEVGALAKVFSMVELELGLTFRKHPHRFLFSRPVPEDFTKVVPSLMLHTSSLDTLIHAYTTGNSRSVRHQSLNLHALKKYGTVEFRLFNSTLDVQALGLMVDFSRKLVTAVRTGNPKLTRYLQSLKGTDASLDEVASAIGVNFGEHRDTLNRVAEEAKRIIDFGGELSSTSVVAFLIAAFLAEEMLPSGNPAPGSG